MREDSKDWKKIVYPVVSGLILTAILEGVKLSWDVGELGVYIDVIYLVLVIVISALVIGLLYRRVIQLRRKVYKSNRTVQQLRSEHTLAMTNVLYESKFEVEEGKQWHVSPTIRDRGRIMVELWILGGDANFYAMPDFAYFKFMAQRKDTTPGEPPPVHSTEYLMGHNIDSCKQVLVVTRYNLRNHFVIDATRTSSGKLRCTLRITKLEYIRAK